MVTISISDRYDILVKDTIVASFHIFNIIYQFVQVLVIISDRWDHGSDHSALLANHAMFAFVYLTCLHDSSSASEGSHGISDDGEADAAGGERHAQRVEVVKR